MELNDVFSLFSPYTRKLQHKLTMIERELSHSQAREAAANQHLNRVLEIAEQTAAERDSFKKMVCTQSNNEQQNKIVFRHFGSCGGNAAGAPQFGPFEIRPLFVTFCQYSIL